VIRGVWLEPVVSWLENCMLVQEDILSGVLVMEEWDAGGGSAGVTQLCG